jgi:hypothetical protein
VRFNRLLSTLESVYDFVTGLGSLDLAADNREYAEMLGLGSRERAIEILCNAVCCCGSVAGLGSLDRPRVEETCL